MSVHAIKDNQAISHQELIGERIKSNNRKRRCKVKGCITPLNGFNQNKYCLAHCEAHIYADLLKEDRKWRLDYTEKNHKGTLRRRALRKLKLNTKVKEN